MQFFKVHFVFPSHPSKFDADPFASISRNIPSDITQLSDPHFVAIPVASRFSQESLAVYILSSWDHTSEQDLTKATHEALKKWGLPTPEKLSFTQHVVNAGEFTRPSEYLFGQLSKANMARLGLTRFADIFHDSTWATDWIIDDSKPLPTLIDELPPNNWHSPVMDELAVIQSVARTELTESQNLRFPVSYVFHQATDTGHIPALTLLLSALAAQNRISGHVFELDFDVPRPSFEHPRFIPTAAALNGVLGNTLVLKYGRFDALGKVNDRGSAAENFKQWLRVIAPYEGKLQLIIVLTTTDEEVLQLVQDYLPGIVQVIRPLAAPSLGDHDAAHKYLHMRATSDGVELNDRALELLSEHAHRSGDISVEQTYRQWYREEILLRDFPQYQKLDQHTAQPDPQQRLAALIGLTEPKRVIQSLIGRQIAVKRKINSGIPVTLPTMHMAFVGAPGTGKTEFATRIADLFKAHHLVSEARVVTVTGKSLTSDHLERACGGVLFIDEAYALTGREVFISELISYMELNRRNTVVILAGYRREINQLLATNPGFRSRIAHVINFPDYTSEEKLAIFEFMVNQIEHNLTPEARSFAREVFERMGVPSDQGNARFVRSLFEKSLVAQEFRLSRSIMSSDEETAAVGTPAVCAADTTDTATTSMPAQHTTSTTRTAITAQPENQDADQRLIIEADIRQAAQAMDIDAAQRQKELSELSLDDMIGLSNVKAKLAEYLTYHSHARQRRDAGKRTAPLPLHMAFKGNPGTGKSEVARLVGHALAEAGVLATGLFVPVSGYQIANPLAVSAAFHQARGGILFIDEAYSINQPSADAQAAIVALLDHMEQYRDEVVVILAGYTKEIDELIRTNPGFASRVDTHVIFEDYSPEELVDIAKMMVARADYSLSEAAITALTEMFRSLCGTLGFANARSVRNILHAALKKHALRMVNSGLASDATADDVIDVCDLEQPLQDNRPHHIGFQIGA
ncbi:AAA family ATPase [Trueperella sp. LYQ143]|uniref:AAA family ATPase n=1 Tax=Trueperella sp. LYQ143 TaxID=3391059 RepID=UPI003983A387